MKRKTVPPVLAAWVLLLAAWLGGEALAQAGAGTTPDNGFTLERAVVGAGGRHAAGAGFELDATAGQPAAGPASGADLALQAGFWSACVAAAPLAPTVTVTRSASDVVLAWAAIPADAQYQVWVSTDPYFDPDNPGGVTAILTSGTSYIDYGAATSLTNHFYVVRGLNACGAASGNSLRKGEFTFGLVPGTP